MILPAEAASQAPLDQYLTQLGQTLAAQLQPVLASQDPSAQQQAAFVRTEQLLAALLSRLGASSQDVLLQQTVAPVAAALLGPVQAGSAPPSAATCLADLVRGFGPEVMAVAAARQEGRGRTTGLCHIGQPAELSYLLSIAPASTSSSASCSEAPSPKRAFDTSGALSSWLGRIFLLISRFRRTSSLPGSRQGAGGAHRMPACTLQLAAGFVGGGRFALAPMLLKSKVLCRPYGAGPGVSGLGLPDTVRRGCSQRRPAQVLHPGQP